MGQNVILTNYDKKIVGVFGHSSQSNPLSGGKPPLTQMNYVYFFGN